MSEPFLGQIMMVGFNFAPRGWALCDGQILPINQNQSLYTLLGTTYGGDGRTSFALPDLRGRVPLHVGGGHTQGARFGEETHVLTAAEIPGHTHGLRASNLTANEDDPSGNLWARSDTNAYSGATDATMHTDSVSTAGGQPHENMQPFLAINFVIALQGLFPSRN